MTIKANILLAMISTALGAGASVVAGQDRITSDGPEQGQSINKHARVEYYKDQATPDGVVFRSFLLRLTYLSTMSREDAVHKVVDSFRLSHDEAGNATAESLYNRLEATYYLLEEEIAMTQSAIICPRGKSSRTKQEVYVAFSEADDAVESISDKYLRKTQDELTATEFGELLNYLAKSKTGFYYVKTDHAAKYADMPSMDIRDDVVRICAKLGVSDVSE